MKSFILWIFSAFSSWKPRSGRKTKSDVGGYHQWKPCYSCHNTHTTFSSRYWDSAWSNTESVLTRPLNLPPLLKTLSALSRSHPSAWEAGRRGGDADYREAIKQEAFLLFDIQDLHSMLFTSVVSWMAVTSYRSISSLLPGRWVVQAVSPPTESHYSQQHYCLSLLTFISIATVLQLYHRWYRLIHSYHWCCCIKYMLQLS